MLAFKIRFAIITTSKRDNELEIEMAKAELKFENVHPSELNAGDAIEINGGLKTVGKETVKSGFFGTLVDGVNVKTVKRVLFPKWYKGQVTGYHAQI